jgi:hypothetical protein
MCVSSKVASAGAMTNLNMAEMLTMLSHRSLRGIPWHWWKPDLVYTFLFLAAPQSGSAVSPRDYHHRDCIDSACQQHVACLSNPVSFYICTRQQDQADPYLFHPRSVLLTSKSA